MELKEIKKYNKSIRVNKVLHFLKQKNIEIENNTKIYFLKSLNKKNGSETITKLIKIIDAERNLSLAIIPNEKTVEFDQLDSKNTVSIFGEEYYDLYLVTNILNSNYYMLIQENNFFKDRADFQLAHLKQVKRFNYKLLFFSRSRIN